MLCVSLVFTGRFLSYNVDSKCNQLQIVSGVQTKEITIDQLLVQSHMVSDSLPENLKSKKAEKVVVFHDAEGIGQS